MLMIGLAVAGGISVRGSAGEPPTGGAPTEKTIRFETPIAAGRVSVGDLLINLCDAVGLPPPDLLGDLDWSIDARTAFGWLQLEAIRRTTGGAIDVDIDEESLVVTIAPGRLETVRRKLQTRVGPWLQEMLGDAIDQHERPHGLSFVTGVDAPTPLDGLAVVPSRVVILLHGLDHPPTVWRDVIAALDGAGYAVARLEYPNDGPIADAADSLAIALMQLRVAGVERVDLVAHSMGGLVARDVLTRKAYYDGDGSGGQRFPAVDRLIMIGTPNAGSHLVRLRGVAELTEHLYRAWEGEKGWLNTAADGRGEAAEDLVPESVFLRRLNARPPATHTRHTIIAGRLSPVSEERLHDMADHARRLARSDVAPRWLQRMADSPETDLVISLLGAAVRGLGDGVVTLESAQLAGIDDFVVVEAEHLTMILNVLPSERTPPAIPVILDRLEEAISDQGSESS